MSSMQTGFFDSLVAAARENPLAAALIGGGAFWLLVGNDSLKGAARSTASAASTMVDSGASTLRSAASTIQRTAAPPTAPEMDHDSSFAVGDRLRDAGRAASDAVAGTAGRMRDQLGQGVTYAREGISRLGDQLPGTESVAKVQSSLTDLLETQPLVLGVVGMAVGAALAGAFPITELENQYVGSISDDVKSDLNSRMGAVSQTLRQSADTLVSEVTDSGAEALDRVKQTGKDAVQAAREKAST